MVLRDLVVYEVVIRGLDTKSLKPVRNVFHMRNRYLDYAAGVYGDPVIGSDSQFLLGRLDTIFLFDLTASLSANLRIDGIDLKEITGFVTYGPEVPIAAEDEASPVTVTLNSRHGLKTGQQVTITGGSGGAAPGVYTITVTGPKTFILNGSTSTGPYIPNSSTYHALATRPRFTYGATDSKDSLTNNVGQVTGDALPLQDTWSIQKKTSRSGRKWRGGLRMGPVPEAHSENGRFSDVAHALHVASMANVNVAYSGLAAPGGGGLTNWRIHLVSKAIAFTTFPSPYTSSDAWSTGVTTLLSNRNTGGLKKRKPKLNAPILV